MDEEMTMSIAAFAKRWRIGDKTMREIIASNPDFPCLRLNKSTTKRRAKVLVLTNEADIWIKRNLR